MGLRTTLPALSSFAYFSARIDISDHDTGEDDEASSPEVLTSIQAKQGLEVAEVVGIQRENVKLGDTEAGMELEN